MTLLLQPMPYQGSKRNIAEKILKYASRDIRRLIEPFAGSAAVTLYAASQKIAHAYLVSDSYKPLMDLWTLIIQDPEECSSQYARLWRTQLSSPGEYYLKVRREFNGDRDPVKFLYLMMRCAKNAIRFNSNGEFNQAADKRRLGRRPSDMRKQLLATSILLRRKVKLMCADYEEILNLANPTDLVYMDPPYQGTSSGRNPRYHQGLEFERFIRNLEVLNARQVPFIVSLDGQLGEKRYGKPLPKSLQLTHTKIRVGRSAQATLNGKSDITIESLYLSPYLSRIPQRAVGLAAQLLLD